MMTLSPPSSVETCCAQGIHMSLYMWHPIHLCFAIQKLARSSVYHFQRDCADVVHCNCVCIQCNQLEIWLTTKWLLFEINAVNIGQNISARPRKFHGAVLQTPDFCFLNLKSWNSLPPLRALGHMLQSPDQKWAGQRRAHAVARWCDLTWCRL